MKYWEITRIESGASFGVFPGETEDDALGALLSDCGITDPLEIEENHAAIVHPWEVRYHPEGWLIEEAPRGGLK